MAKKKTKPKLSPLHKDLLAQRARLIQSEAEVAAQVSKLASGLVAKWNKLLGKIKAGSHTAASIADTTRLGYILREMGKVTDAEIAKIEKLAGSLYKQTFKEESARYGFALSKAGLTPTAGYSLHGLSKQAAAVAATSPLPGLPMYQSFKTLSQTAKKRMQADVADAIATGWNPTALARKWSSGAGAGRLVTDSETLARTSLMAASNQAMVARARSMQGAVKALRWEATFDVRTCPVCGGRHGKVYSLSALPPMPAHPNCRCVWIPVFGESSLNSALSEVTPYPAPSPASMLGGTRDFERWLTGQSTGQQLDFFGSELKQKSWATGKVSLEEMASPTGRVMTDAELLARYPIKPATSFAPLGPVAGGDSVNESVALSDVRAAVLKAAKEFQPEIDKAVAAVAKAKKEIAALREAEAPKSEVSKAIQRHTQAKLKVIERKAEAAKVSRAALRVANPMKIAYSADAELSRNSHAISEAVDFASGVVDAKSIESVNLKMVTEHGRSFHRPGELHMSTFDGSNLYVHEIAHEIEQRAGWVEEARKFVLSRSKGEALQEMSVLDPKGGYFPGEVAFKDKFKNAYMGRWYQNGKATEVVSMGMQWLFEDAAGFAKADPEYFDFVTKLMRGAKGKAVTGAGETFTAMATYTAEDLLAIAKKIVAGEDPVALTQGMSQQQLAKVKQKVQTQKALAKTHGTITVSADKLLDIAKQVVAGADIKLLTQGMTDAEIAKIKQKVQTQKSLLSKKMTLTAPEIEAQKVAAQIGKMTPAESAALDAKFKADTAWLKGEEEAAAKAAKVAADKLAQEAALKKIADAEAQDAAKMVAETEKLKVQAEKLKAQAAMKAENDAALKSAQSAAVKYTADDLVSIANDIEAGASFNDATFGMSKFQIEEVKNHLAAMQGAVNEFASDAAKLQAKFAAAEKMTADDLLAVAKQVVAGGDMADLTLGMSPVQIAKVKQKIQTQKALLKKKTGTSALPPMPTALPKANLIPEPPPVDYGGTVTTAPMFPPAAVAGTEGVPTVIDASKFKRIGEQKGSNPGGFYEDHTGTKWYVKTPADVENARNEVLANKLYEAMGIAVPEVQIATIDGKVGIASRVETITQASPEVLKKAVGVREGFAADAWLANWDVVGQSYDNLALARNGEALRIDTGGALRFRAKGKLKGSSFGNDVAELSSLLNGSQNPQSASVFGGITDAEIFKGIDKVAAITPTQIEKLVNTFGPVNPTERTALTNVLRKRRQFLVEWRKTRIAELNAEAIADASGVVKKYKTIADATKQERDGLQWWVNSAGHTTLFHLFESPEADWRAEQVIAKGFYSSRAAIKDTITRSSDKLKALESLLKKSPRLAKPETIWRSVGVTDDFYQRIVTQWIANGEWTADFTQSASRSVSYGQNSFGGGEAHKIVFEFENTVQALDMDKFAGRATGGPIYEAELFIIKGSRFEITKVTKSGKRTTLHLRDKLPK